MAQLTAALPGKGCPGGARSSAPCPDTPAGGLPPAPTRLLGPGDTWGQSPHPGDGCSSPSPVGQPPAMCLGGGFCAGPGVCGMDPSQGTWQMLDGLSFSLAKLHAMSWSEGSCLPPSPWLRPGTAAKTQPLSSELVRRTLLPPGCGAGRDRCGLGSAPPSR